MNKLKLLAVAALMLAMVAESACTSTDAIKILQVTVDAAGVALPIISASAGIPPVLEAQLEGYLQAVNVAVGQSATILAGLGTPGEKRAQIIAAFASISLPLLPPGLPAAVANAVQAVANDVARFLATVTAPVPPSAASRVARAVTLDQGSKIELARIQTKVKVNLDALGAQKHHPVHP